MTLKQLYEDAINICPEHLINYQFKKDNIFLRTLAKQINKIKPEIDIEELIKILKENTLKKSFEIIKNIIPEQKLEKNETKKLKEELDTILEYLANNHFKIDAILINIEDEVLIEKFKELTGLKKHIENLMKEKDESDIVKKLYEYNQNKFNKLKEQILLYPDIKNQLNKILSKSANKIKIKK